MKYLHTMVRVTDIEASLDFYVNKLGLRELRRTESEKGRFTLVGSFGSAPAIALSTMPQQSAVRAIGPSLSSDQQSAIAPCRLTRP